jgi:hypothetical protein
LFVAGLVPDAGVAELEGPEEEPGDEPDEGPEALSLPAGTSRMVLYISAAAASSSASLRKSSGSTPRPDATELVRKPDEEE